MGILYRDWFSCASIGGKKTKEEGLVATILVAGGDLDV